MFLPGATLTAAVLELGSGQVVSGASRLVSGILSLALLAFGILAGTEVAGVSAGQALAGATPLLGAWAPWLGVATFAIGVAITSSAPRGSMVGLLIVLYAAWAAQLGGNALWGIYLGAFIGAVILVLGASLLARLPGMVPRQASFLPGFWLLVPGALGLIGLTSWATPEGTVPSADLQVTAGSIFAIAVGVLVGTQLWDLGCLRRQRRVPAHERTGPHRSSRDPVEAGGRDAVTRPRRVGCALVLTIVVAAGVSGCSSGSAPVTAPPSPGACDASMVAERVLPSVVTVSTTTATGISVGSGNIIRDDGYILTNSHVVPPPAEGVATTVLLSDGSSHAASLVGRDAATDLAVLKIDASTPLPAIPLGSSGTVQVGAPVVAVGSPLGLSGTVTAGIVSARDRSIEVPSDGGQTAVLLAAVQTDAAINPGNSGGALTNCSGELIGVPSAIATVPTDPQQSAGGSIGLGFAIPVDLAKEVADELIATGAVVHSSLGISVVPVSAGAAAQSGQPEGLYVTAVVPGGPSQVAGLIAGDIVTAVDGEPVSDAEQLALLTITKKPGEVVSLSYARQGTTADATITLGIQP